MKVKKRNLIELILQCVALILLFFNKCFVYQVTKHNMFGSSKVLEKHYSYIQRTIDNHSIIGFLTIALFIILQQPRPIPANKNSTYITGTGGKNVRHKKQIGIRTVVITVVSFLPIVLASGGLIKLAKRLPIANADKNPPETVKLIPISSIRYGNIAPTNSTIAPFTKNAK